MAQSASRMVWRVSLRRGLGAIKGRAIVSFLLSDHTSHSGLPSDSSYVPRSVPSSASLSLLKPPRRGVHGGPSRWRAVVRFPSPSPSPVCSSIFWLPPTVSPSAAALVWCPLCPSGTLTLCLPSPSKLRRRPLSKSSTPRSPRRLTDLDRLPLSRRTNFHSRSGPHRSGSGSGHTIRASSKRLCGTPTRVLPCGRRRCSVLRPWDKAVQPAIRQRSGGV